MITASELADLKKRAEELRKLVHHSGLTYRPLHSDFTFACKNWLKDRDSQFWSRTSIRCLCAAIEATLFSFRQMARQMAPLSKIEFEPEEQEILCGRKIVNGVETKRPKYLSPSDSIKESFRLFGKALGATVVVDYGVQGFADLCMTFEIRNRLMHPKSPFDVQVDRKDIDTADRAILWFNRTYQGVIDQCQKHVNENVAKLMEKNS